MSGLNPDASSFSFNPTASTWAPPGDEAAPEAPEPAPDAPEAAGEKEEEEDELDESDPLWLVTLKIANGDRSAAMKMLENPDALMTRPEVLAVLGSGEDAEDWESGAAPAADAPEAAAVAPAEEAKGEEAPAAVEENEDDDEDEDEDEDDGDENEGDDDEVAEGHVLPHLNVVFIGHVDAGKSTLSGNILYLTGHVDRRTVEKYEQEAKDKNRESWFLAFIMDTNEEERAKGKTVEVGRAHFATERKRFTILDAPGHKSYVPNMIQGASQADVGILVISARRGEFETGFERGGQTREHALLAKTLGVQHLIVVINKMDDPTVEWSQERYDECCAKLKPFLKQCGFRPKFDVRFLPVSGLTGANVMDEVTADVCPWWAGCYSADPPANFTSEATLLAQLDALEVARDPEGPLRIPVLDRYTDRGTMIMGKVESGTIRRGQRVRIMPIDRVVTASAVFCDEDPVARCLPGENVKIKLTDVGIEELQKGFVICSEADGCSVVTTFRAQIALVDMLEHRPLFTPGYTCMFHAHCVEEVVVCTRIGAVKVKGEEKRQRFAKQGYQVSCELKLERSCCLETFEAMQQLGRFTLRDEGQSIGIGKIMRIMD